MTAVATAEQAVVLGPPDPVVPSPPPLDGGQGVAQHSALLSVSASVVGVCSYACTLVMAHVLAAREYSEYAAGQMLVGIVGIAASALVPLPLAGVVRGNAEGSERRVEGMTFALLVSAGAGMAAAVVAGTVMSLFAPLPVAAAVAASALALFAISPAWGWMQGELRFVRYALFTVAEVAARLAFSIGAVVLGWGAAGALGGFVVGALVVALAAVRGLRADIAWRPRVLVQRPRWAETGDIALTQLVVATLVGADVVLVSLLGDATTTEAGYQALATLTKGPVYVAAGTVLVTFPLLRSTASRVPDILSAALRSFVHLALPTAAVLATLPAEVVLWVLPERYADALVLLPWLAAAGLGYAVLTVLATVLLALRAYRRSQLGLVVAAVALPAALLTGWRLDGIHGLAVGGALGALGATAVLGAIAAPLLPAGTGRLACTGLAATAGLAGVLQLLRPIPALWLLGTAVAAVLVIQSLRGRLHLPRGGAAAAPEQARGLRPLARRVAAVPAWGQAVVAGVVAFGVRAVGLRTANDVFIDELTYAQLAGQVSRGQWPHQFGTPFFLHPIGSFLLDGGVITALGLTGTDMDVALDLRWVNAVLGAVAVAVAFVLVRLLVGLPAALVATAVLTFDPFVLRSDTRLMLETPATAPVLAGWLVMVVVATRPPGRRTGWLEIGAGLLFGLGLVTKDLTFVLTVVPLLLAAGWRHTLTWRRAGRVLAACVVPYLVFLAVVTGNGLLGPWWAAKSSGLRRLLGLDQETGFNAVGSPGIVPRLLVKMTLFGTSYLLVGLAVFAGALAVFSGRPERRLVGLLATATGVLGMYAFTAGAAEEQIGYYAAVTAVPALAVCAVELSARRPGLRPWVRGFACAFAAATVFLGASARLTADDGYLAARAWLDTSVAPGTAVGLTTVTGEFGLLPHPGYGVWPSIASLDAHHAQYVLTESNPLQQGYGYAAPGLLVWLQTHARSAFDFYGPSKGHTTVWRIVPGSLAEAVLLDIDFRPVTGGYR